MWLRIVSLLLLVAGLAGCSSKDEATSSKSPTTQRLPAEVTGNPEDALPKQKTQPRH
jgi:type IV pilus biogenesis protein CpaD/CtpE